MLELRKSSDRKAYVAGTLAELPQGCTEKQLIEVTVSKGGKQVRVTVLGGYYFPAGGGTYGAWVASTS